MSNTVVKPALKRNSSSGTKRNLKWDENNLEINEKIKADLAPTKIVEPKTPYHGPTSDSELDDAMAPLNLDEEAQVQNGCFAPEELQQLEQLQHEHDDQNGDSDHSMLYDGDGTPIEGSPASRRQSFEEHRKVHYNMKDALKRGRELLEGEEPPR